MRSIPRDGSGKKGPLPHRDFFSELPPKSKAGKQERTLQDASLISSYKGEKSSPLPGRRCQPATIFPPPPQAHACQGSRMNLTVHHSIQKAHLFPPTWGLIALKKCYLYCPAVFMSFIGAYYVIIYCLFISYYCFDFVLFCPTALLSMGGIETFYRKQI